MLEYDHLENIKTDCVNTVVFNLHQIKHLKFFLGHPVAFATLTSLLTFKNYHSGLDFLLRNINNNCHS